MRYVVYPILALCTLWLYCEPEYSERYLYIAVVGEYGIPFTGAYGDYHDQHAVESTTPDYYYYHLQRHDNQFIGTFKKAAGVKKDFRCLTVRLYLKEYPEPASLIMELSQVHPDSSITVTYVD